MPRYCRHLLLSAIVFFLLPGKGSGQTASINVPLVVTDSSDHTATVYFGVNPAATYCIDPSLDEFELPANRCGSAPLCVYFVDPRTNPGSCFGNGLILDLRASVSPAQVDTYKVVMTTPDYPIVVRWPDHLGQWYDSLLLTDEITGTIVSTGMNEVDSVVISNKLINHFLIIAHGPHGVRTSVVEPKTDPLTPLLSQNYPNPFNPSTVIRYTVVSAGHVDLKIYDLLGRLKASLVEGERQAGEYRISWRPEGLPGGIYFYRLTTSRGSITHSMIYQP